MSPGHRPMLRRDLRYHPYHLLEDDTQHESEELRLQSRGVTVHRSTIALLLSALLVSLSMNTFLAIRHYHSHFHATYGSPSPYG